MVVDRVPRRRDVRLAHDERAVIGLHEAGAVGLRLRDAAVAHLDLEGLARAEALARRDRELAAVSCPGGGAAVDLDRVDGQPLEVEVEARQALGRAGANRRLALEDVRVRVVRDFQVVVAGVVAAVPVEREVRVARPRRSRRGGSRAVAGACGRRPDDQGRADEGERRCPSHTASTVANQLGRDVRRHQPQLLGFGEQARSGDAPGGLPGLCQRDRYRVGAAAALSPVRGSSRCDGMSGRSRTTV